MLSDSANDYLLLIESLVLLTIGLIYAFQVLRKVNKIERKSKKK